MDDMRNTRKALGLTQAEMAERLGVHQATISRFESGLIPLDARTKLALRAIAPTPQQAEAA